MESSSPVRKTCRESLTADVIDQTGRKTQSPGSERSLLAALGNQLRSLPGQNHRNQPANWQLFLFGISLRQTFIFTIHK